MPKAQFLIISLQKTEQSSVNGVCADRMGGKGNRMLPTANGGGAKGSGRTPLTEAQNPVIPTNNY